MRTLILVVAALAGWTAAVCAEKPARPAFIPGEAVAKFASPEASAVLNDLGVELVEKLGPTGAVLLRSASEEDPKTLALKLMASGKFAFAEPNYLYYADDLPNDPDFAKLWGLKNSGQTGGTAGADIKATEAWQISKGDKNVLVAVIDTGIDYTHPDLAANMWTNAGETGNDAQGRDKKANNVDDDNNGFVDDWHGWDFVNKDNDPMDDNNHGTHCAGTIGGVGNNGVGVAGVNWQVSMVGIKFLSGSGSGSLADAVKAINYAATLGAHVQSNSWGGGGFSQAMLDAINFANQRGALFVAAAGNSGSNNDQQPHYPSSYEAVNVLAIAASDHTDVLASFSCWGPVSVDVAAPGAKIYSTIPGGGYDTYSGTSMATPHVSGVAALIKAVYPKLDNLGIKARIISSVDPIAAMKGKIATGGRVNVQRALEDDSKAPDAVTDLALTGSDLSALTFSFTATGDDGKSGTASQYLARYSLSPIKSMDDFNKAIDASSSLNAPKAPGEKESFTIKKLEFAKAYYVAVVIMDNAGNLSGLSNIATGKTKDVQAIFLDGMEGGAANWTTQGTWAITDEKVKEGSKAFSDSPKAQYASDANMAIVSKPIALKTSGLVIVSFAQHYDLEARYDWGLFEYSLDNGKTFKTAKRFTGQTADYTVEAVELGEKLEGAELVLRFRLISDKSTTADGWYIDNVMVVTGK